MTYRNFGTFLICKPDVFSFRLLGFGLLVINLVGIPIHCRAGLKIGDVLFNGLHPWN
jgi:hypothetical protein